MSQATSDSDLLVQLAQEFAERYRRGEQPALTEYAGKHPALAERIRELFPAMIVMEQLGTGGGQKDLPPAWAASGDAAAPQQLGEYRILREVARGGMGIVYEAVQESLGRHVALKVLPFQRLKDAHQLERFRREARAAAKLHHTNIVPVFGVGEHDGVHYYAMQFIDGQGLDGILRELQRLQAASEKRQAAGLSTSPELQGGADLRRELARGLLTDCYPATMAENKSSGSRLRQPGPSPQPLPAEAPGLPSRSTTQHYRSVAQIGAQVADALDYAHQHGLLHRDIKPGNLLLDRQGTVWITDFGLVKEEGGAELTMPGDIVGTLRYMAPERFNGVSDPRSDIYSLGLTLYEILTLRPAFVESDRARLIGQIVHEEPPTPRTLDRRVPRDLETIVLKAMAKEPELRYQNAAELAEDLRCFLADRPILARRTSIWERSWRWCRRNPVVASLVGIVVLLVLGSAIGGGVLSWQLWQALEQSEKAEAEKTEKLWQSYLDRARAERVSGRVGQRFKALKAIREAAKIRVTPELRNEAAAALVLPDLEVAREWEGFPEGSLRVEMSADFTKFARLHRSGEVVIGRVTETGTEEVLMRLPSFAEPPYIGPWWSPDGRFVLVGRRLKGGGAAGKIRLWRVDGAKPIACLSPEDENTAIHEFAVDFRPDSRRLAVGTPDSTIRIFDLPTGRRLNTLALKEPAFHLSYQPTHHGLAVTSRAVTILDPEGRRPPVALSATPLTTGLLAWHPHGRLLAVPGNDFKIHLWHTRLNKETASAWTGHRDAGIVQHFSHSGDLAISRDYTSQSRLWDAVTGRLLLSMPDDVGSRWSPDDALLGPQVRGTKVRLWRVAAGREARLLRRRTVTDVRAVYAPRGLVDPQVLAAGDSGGWLTFFDLERGGQLASLQLPVAGAGFVRSQHGDRWLISSNNGAQLWPARREPGRPDLFRIGPPERLVEQKTVGVSASSDAGVLAIPLDKSALVLNRAKPELTFPVTGLHDVRATAVSPDGRWVVLCSHTYDQKTSCARIWDVPTGKHVHDLPVFEPAAASFSPDNRWLVTFATAGQGRVWEAGTWRELWRFDPSHVAFSPDSAMMALGGEPGIVRLVEPATGKELGRLTGPDMVAYLPAAFTRDGARLIAETRDFNHLCVWDLRRIRAGLKDLGLDWDWPEVPAAAEAAPFASIEVEPASGDARPMAIEVDMADLIAREKYTFILSMFPFHAEAYYQRGVGHKAFHQWQEALDDFSMALTLKPDHALASYERGLMHARNGRHAQAIEDFTRTMRLQPKHAAAHGGRGRAYAALNQWDKAVPDYSKAIELDPKDWQHWHGRAKVHFHFARWQQAIADYSKVIELKPDQVGAWNERGIAHGYLGQNDRAIEDTTKALELAPDDPVLKYNRGVAQSMLGGQLLGQKKYADAEPLLLEGYEAMKQAEYKVQFKVLLSKPLERLVRLYDATGRKENAAQWRMKLEPAKRAEELWRDLLTGKQARHRFIETKQEGALTAEKQKHAHALEMKAGTTYVLDMESPAFDTFLILEDANGSPVAENDDISRTNLNSRVIYTAPTTGTYRLIATCYRPGAKGAYVLRIRQVVDKKK